MSWFGYQGDGVAYALRALQGRAARRCPSRRTRRSRWPASPARSSARTASPGCWRGSDAAPADRDGELRLAPKGTERASPATSGSATTWASWPRSSRRAAPRSPTTTLVQVTGTVHRVRAAARRRAGGLRGRPRAHTVVHHRRRRRLHRHAARRAPTRPRPGRRAAAPTAKQTLTVSRRVRRDADLRRSSPRARLTVTVHRGGRRPDAGEGDGVLQERPSCAAPHRALVAVHRRAQGPGARQRRAGRLRAGLGHGDASPLPPGQYDVVVSRGPEYSIFPNTFPAVPGAARRPAHGQDATVDAVLAHVLDTTGWMSADFHVHAVNSPDRIVDNDDARALLRRRRRGGAGLHRPRRGDRLRAR